MALALSSALHAGIIFLTTTGQGAKIQGKPFLKEFQVGITEVAPPAKVVSQLQDKADSVPAMPTSNSEEVRSEQNGVIPITQERYYKIKELDVIPRPISLISPRYPEAVPASVRRGVVKLEIKLDEDGVVTEVTVLGGEPPGYFEDAARDEVPEGIGLGAAIGVSTEQPGVDSRNGNEWGHPQRGGSGAVCGARV